jgi:hypothetical protein
MVAETLGMARTETEVILAKARRQAEQITGDAVARAKALELDAQERHRQAMGSLVQDREELEHRVVDLRVFEREYRGRLQAFLEGQLKDLWQGVVGVQAPQALAEMRIRAARHPGQRASGVLLREDGTYEVVQFRPADEGDARPEAESEAQRKHWPPEGEYKPPDVGGSR